MEISDSVFLLALVRTTHFYVILFVLLTPFLTNDPSILFLHAFFIVVVLVHWITNQNVCCLTTMEKALQKKIKGSDVNESECFTCSIINPIYDVTKNHKEFNRFSYGIIGCAWLASVWKLQSLYKSGKYESFSEMLVPSLRSTAEIYELL